MSDFLTGMRIAGSGMQAQRTRINVVSSNLANASTTRTPEGGPYKRKDVVMRAETLPESFQDLIGKPIGDNAHAVKVDQVIQDTSTPRKVFDPDHPDADPQGYVSYPNIQVMDEMVNMMTATRSYNACATVIENLKTMARRALDLIR
jgi:flagellar basal-body rod protein FlgC